MHPVAARKVAAGVDRTRRPGAETGMVAQWFDPNLGSSPLDPFVDSRVEGAAQFVIAFRLIGIGIEQGDGMTAGGSDLWTAIAVEYEIAVVVVSDVDGERLAAVEILNQAMKCLVTKIDLGNTVVTKMGQTLFDDVVVGQRVNLFAVEEEIEIRGVVGCLRHLIPFYERLFFDFNGHAVDLFVLQHAVHVMGLIAGIGAATHTVSGGLAAGLAVDGDGLDVGFNTQQTESGL